MGKCSQEKVVVVGNMKDSCQIWVWYKDDSKRILLFNDQRNSYQSILSNQALLLNRYKTVKLMILTLFFLKAFVVWALPITWSFLLLVSSWFIIWKAVIWVFSFFPPLNIWLVLAKHWRSFVVCWKHDYSHQCRIYLENYMRKSKDILFWESSVWSTSSEYPWQVSLSIRNHGLNWLSHPEENSKYL